MSASECYDETSYVMIYIEYNIDGYSIHLFIIFYLFMRQ